MLPSYTPFVVYAAHASSADTVVVSAAPLPDGVPFVLSASTPNDVAVPVETSSVQSALRLTVPYRYLYLRDRLASLLFMASAAKLLAPLEVGGPLSCLA